MHTQLGAAQEDDDKQRDFCKDSIAQTEKTKEEKTGQARKFCSKFIEKEITILAKFWRDEKVPRTYRPRTFLQYT